MQEDFNEINETIRYGFKSLASAIMPSGVFAGTDATGGHVESLTEAVMGITTGLTMIAESISDLAEAVRESKQ